MPAEIFRTWVNLLCLASAGGGGLPPIKDIAFALRVPPKVAESRISRLIADELLDMRATEGGTILTPHNWDKRQFLSDGSTERVRKFRAGKKLALSVAGNGDETFHETAPERSTKRSPSVSVSVSGSASENVSSQEDEFLRIDTCGGAA